MPVRAVLFLGLAFLFVQPSFPAAGQLDSIKQIRSGETITLVSGPWRAQARFEPLGGSFELDLIVSGDRGEADALKATVALAPGQRHRVIVRGDDPEGTPGGFEAFRDGNEIVLTAFHPDTLPPPSATLVPRETDGIRKAEAETSAR